MMIRVGRICLQTSSEIKAVYCWVCALILPSAESVDGCVKCQNAVTDVSRRTIKRIVQIICTFCNATTFNLMFDVLDSTYAADYM